MTSSLTADLFSSLFSSLLSLSYLFRSGRTITQAQGIAEDLARDAEAAGIPARLFCLDQFKKVTHSLLLSRPSYSPLPPVVSVGLSKPSEREEERRETQKRRIGRLQDLAQQLHRVHVSPLSPFCVRCHFNTLHSDDSQQRFIIDSLYSICPLSLSLSKFDLRKERVAVFVCSTTGEGAFVWSPLSHCCVCVAVLSLRLP